MKELEKRLVKEGWVTSAQLIKAKEEQKKKKKKSLFSVLVTLGYLSEEDIYLFFAQSAQIPFVRPGDYLSDEELFNLFSEDFYREHLFVPLFRIGNTLYIGTANPLDTEFMDTLRKHTNLDIFPLFASPSSILEAINRVFGPEKVYLQLEELVSFSPSLSILPLGRESERIVINTPVEFKVIDKRITLASSQYLKGTALNISQSGKGVGIRTFLFLPSGAKILLKFPSFDPNCELEAEITHCRMEQGYYFLGVKFLQTRKDLLRYLLEEKK